MPLACIHQAGFSTHLPKKNKGREVGAQFVFLSSHINISHVRGGEKFWKARWKGRTRSVLVHQKGQMSDCFKSFPTGAEILIFAAQEHYQYPQREAMIIINESHFQTNALAVQSACDLQSKAKQSKGSQQTRNEQSVSILLLQLELISLICLPRWLCSRWLIHEHVENGASPEDATLLFE